MPAWWSSPDEPALAAALSKMLADGNFRATCKRGAAQARNRLLPWDVAVRRFAEILGRVPSGG